jgi:polyisoprenoid-binding protein YceI
MASHSGTYSLGPDSATLTVTTGKTGAAAMAGHNLTITVGSWSAELTLADDAGADTLTLSIDSRSMRTRAGSGGAQALDADDMPKIDQTIEKDVLKGKPITFASTHIHDGDGPGELHVHGEVTVLGKTAPVEFTLTIDDAGALSAAAVVTQSEFGMKPYSILFGTIKVADAVEVSVEGTLPAAS